MTLDLWITPSISDHSRLWVMSLEFDRLKSFTWRLHSLKNPEKYASWWLHCRKISSFKIFKMEWVARRYTPMSWDHIPGFPNKIPKVDLSRNLPTFNDDDRKDAALHLVRFHMHIRKLKVDFPEDFLMNIFMATLEGEARSWYESLPPTCTYCLKDFHAMFF